MRQKFSDRSPFIAAFNRLGAGLKHVGLSLVRFDEQDLLEEACRRTGLEDFGEDSFREPLRILLNTYDSEARLTLVGRLAAKHDTLRLLMTRLRLVHDRKRSPAITEQEIIKPLFIIGLPRTGSTLLHNLLAQDPANRTPLTWEVMEPSPPPEKVHFTDDPRIASTEKLLKKFDWLAQDFKRIHPMHAHLPTECVAIMSPSFASPQFQSTYQVPSYQKWLHSENLRPAYTFHRRFLQHLQWRCPPQRWVLKAPAHIFALDSLFAVYPDARIIQIHRHPLEVIGSVTSLDIVLRRAFSDAIDPKAIGVEAVKQWAEAANLMTNVHQHELVKRNGVLDVYYRDLVHDPISTVQRIYEYFALPFTNQAKDGMEKFLKENPQNKHGVHTYSLSQFGLSSEFVLSHFKHYIYHFHLDLGSS